jgi:hypothetical protein
MSLSAGRVRQAGRWERAGTGRVAYRLRGCASAALVEARCIDGVERDDRILRERPRAGRLWLTRDVMSMGRIA